MHYIINNSFLVPSRLKSTNSSMKGPTILSRVTPVNRPISQLSTKFTPNTLYTIKHIKRVENSVEYTFQSNNGEVISENFATCSEADEFIASMKQESLPDYEKFHKLKRS
jgi:chloramphenicol O-acetyltransferase